MNELSVIIPSKAESNLRACISAMRKAGETCRIIVVDDGVDWVQWELAAEMRARWNVKVVAGVKPFIFARNVNLGIKAAGEDDVILLNDDALLETPGGFTAMHHAAQEHREYGLISAATNVAGNPAQGRQRNAHGLRTCPSPTPGNSFATVAFICVLILREVIARVGLLDERFGGMTPDGKRIYGYEDNDYSRRLHLAGLKIGIHDGCFVNHAKLPSNFRGEPHSLQAARDIYLEKWGTM